MPDPLTVWMVQLGRDNAEIEGTLRLDGDALVFEPATKPAELRFPYSAIAKVHRVRGSPVLVVEWREQAELRRTAFYFSEPPPLNPPTPEEIERSAGERRVGPLAQRRAMSKRRHARSNIGYLAVTGVRMKPLVQAWRNELRARVQEARA